MFKILIISLFALSTVSINAQNQKIVVSPDGKGNYKTVQAALNSIPTGNKNWITILVKKGIYKERLILDTRKNFVHLIGEDRDSTILTYDNHVGIKLANGDTVNTWNSASFFVYADNFFAENISFRNDAGFKAGQAVALFVNGDRAKFINCNMTGFQDVLFCSAPSSKQYYKDCYIEGTTDFIFGPATAVFKNCHIHSKKNSHITAASTPREIPYGFVFFDCNLTADTGLNKVSLGRPWQPFASVTYIHCNIGNHIIPEGWNNWKNPANEKTARYAEYNNYGAGSNNGSRVPWVKQLSKKEAEQYTLKNILGDWTVE